MPTRSDGPRTSICPERSRSERQRLSHGIFAGVRCLTDPKALQRLGMYLVRRGFDPDTSRAAIRGLAAEQADRLSYGDAQE